MTIEEQRIEILEQCKIYVDVPKDKPGGQIAGMVYYPTIIEHEGLGIKLSINYHKSMYKNRLMAINLMELALLDIIK
tara:strand:+ start:145419 stop:145649 length:231 start_codon:yes stop_codon:yes gene_type:complete